MYRDETCLFLFAFFFLRIYIKRIQVGGMGGGIRLGTVGCLGDPDEKFMRKQKEKIAARK
jgi:hypothetical protein